MAKRGGFQGGMPGNMSNLMKQAQKMQKQMEEAQQAVAQMEVTGTSGGGAVKITINGSYEMTGINIDKDVVDPDDVEMLCDLIQAAFNEAHRKAEEESQKAMSGVANIGGLGGLPF